MSSLAEPAEAILGVEEHQVRNFGRRPLWVAGRREASSGRASEAARPGAAEPALALGSVLIVEDDAIVAFQIELSLEDDGFKICGVAATAKAGLALFEECRPEYAVLDVRLAEGDGRDVARQIATVSPRTTILMCTAEDEDHVQGVGAHALLRKPFDFHCLGAALVATRGWLKGECFVRAPPQLVRLRPGR